MRGIRHRGRARGARPSREQHRAACPGRRAFGRSGRFQRRHRGRGVRSRPWQFHGRAHLHGDGEGHGLGARGAALRRVDPRCGGVERLVERRARPRSGCGRRHAQRGVSRPVRRRRCGRAASDVRRRGQSGRCARMGDRCPARARFARAGARRGCRAFGDRYRFGRWPGEIPIGIRVCRRNCARGTVGADGPRPAARPSHGGRPGHVAAGIYASFRRGGKRAHPPGERRRRKEPAHRRAAFRRLAGCRSFGVPPARRIPCGRRGAP